MDWIRPPHYWYWISVIPLGFLALSEFTTMAGIPSSVTGLHWPLAVFLIVVPFVIADVVILARDLFYQFSSRSYHQTEGTILRSSCDPIGIRTTPFSRNCSEAMFRPSVGYSYLVDGQTKTGSKIVPDRTCPLIYLPASGISFFPSHHRLKINPNDYLLKYSIGDSVPVYYDSQNSTISCLISGVSMQTVGDLTTRVILAVLLLVACTDIFSKMGYTT